MASNVAFAKQETNWFAFIPRLLFMGILCVCFYPVEKNYFFVIALAIYLLVSNVLKGILIPASSQQSVKLIWSNRFEDAIPYIEKSIAFYTKNEWIDRFRLLLMISTSKKTFREMLLCNLAYCYMRIGDTAKAKELYEDVITHSPENNNAKSMLENIKAISRSPVVH